MSRRQFSLRSLLTVVFAVGVLLAGLRMRPDSLTHNVAFVVAVVAAAAAPLYWFGSDY